MLNAPRRASLLAAAALLTTLTHATRAQDSEVAARARDVAAAVEGQLASIQGREIYTVTDKPLYHPGETVWFRAWEVAVRTMSGTSGDHGITFQLIDPRGAKVAEKRVQCRGGMAANDFTISPSLPGGNYTLRAVSDLGTRDERPLVVSSYEVPRLKKSVEFTRASYAPGDTVTALVSIEKATGEPLTGARVTAAISIDGAPLGTFVVAIDARGNGVVRFQVPNLRKSNLLLTLNADAGGIVETLQKRVPVVLDQVDVKVFPEGGDLVTGLASRVYLMARDEQGKPAEVEGQIVDQHGALVTTFKSLHDGMARFNLTPKADHTYSVKLTRPAAAATTPLPAARAGGCVLRSEDDFAGKGALRITTTCTADTRLWATATLREKVLASQLIDKAGTAPTTTSLELPADATGAVRVTLFDLDKNPVAERLVYRGRGRELRVQVTADKKEYSPRDKVTLTVRTTNGAGQPVPADVALAVVDDSVLRLADSQTPNVLAEMYLLSEMPGQRIHEPNFYFSADLKAPEALDLLLGTQGWRRFAWRWVPRAAPLFHQPVQAHLAARAVARLDHRQTAAVAAGLAPLAHPLRVGRPGVGRRRLGHALRRGLRVVGGA